MRLRVAQAAFFGGILALVLSSCQTAGFSRVYMAADTGGFQPRKVFFTDTIQIVAVAQFSSSRQDATINVKIRQSAAWDWDMDQPTSAQHAFFAIGEASPSPGTETAVTFTLPATGIVQQVQCFGACLPNASAGINPCPPSLFNNGIDSCGPGATCCFDPASTTPVTPQSSLIPFPVGSYSSDFYIDGIYQASAPFDILFPDNADPKFGQDTSHGCPNAPPTDGLPCRFWVRKGTSCTGFDSSKSCTCDVNVWKCT